MNSYLNMTDMRKFQSSPMTKMCLSCFSALFMKTTSWQQFSRLRGMQYFEKSMQHDCANCSKCLQMNAPSRLIRYKLETWTGKRERVIPQDPANWHFPRIILSYIQVEAWKQNIYSSVFSKIRIWRWGCQKHMRKSGKLSKLKCCWTWLNRISFSTSSMPMFLYWGTNPYDCMLYAPLGDIVRSDFAFLMIGWSLFPNSDAEMVNRYTDDFVLDRGVSVQFCFWSHVSCADHTDAEMVNHYPYDFFLARGVSFQFCFFTLCFLVQTKLAKAIGHHLILYFTLPIMVVKSETVYWYQQYQYIQWMLCNAAARHRGRYAVGSCSCHHGKIFDIVLVFAMMIFFHPFLKKEKKKRKKNNGWAQSHTQGNEELASEV